jgi:hypothetical protein
MSLIVSLYAAVLFFILTPSILLRIPKSGSKWVVAAVHALVFGVIFHFTNKLVWRLGAKLEGFEPNSKEVGSPFVGESTSVSTTPSASQAATPSLPSLPSLTMGASASASTSQAPAPLPSITPSISPSPL